MNRNPDDLVESISDGGSIDWDTLESSAGSAEERDELAALRKVYRIAEFNRTLQRTPESLPPDGVGSWGPLTLVELLGEGASGEVWRAWEARLKREVALKLLRPSGTDPKGGQRLLEEAQHLARIRHPGVAQVHGVETHGGRVGLWMELLDGDTLDRIVRDRGAFSPGEAALIGVHLCRALAAVHAAGLLHRDVKAANVVRTRGGRIVLTDFGLGRPLGVPGEEAAPSGTPMYMAPELLEGGIASVESDVYSLGVLLYYLVAARYPSDANTLRELREVRRSGGERRLLDSRPDLPPAFIRVVERALAPDAADRFRSAGEMDAALVPLSGEPESLPAGAAAAATRPSRRRFGVLLAALALLIVVAGTSSLLFRRPGPAAAAYDVEAGFVRFDGSAFQSLVPGDRLAPGDRVALDFRASLPVHVYVLNEDEHGETYLLFPQPAYELGNPVSPGVTHRLPGTIGGDQAAWKVTSAGGREHFLVVASPEPVRELEADLAALSAPREGRPVAASEPVRVPGEALRGLGGIEKLPGATVPSGKLSDIVRKLSGRETGVTGVWIRKFVLENPG